MCWVTVRFWFSAWTGVNGASLRWVFPKVHLENPKSSRIPATAVRKVHKISNILQALRRFRVWTQKRAIFPQSRVIIQGDRIASYKTVKIARAKFCEITFAYTYRSRIWLNGLSLHQCLEHISAVILTAQWELLLICTESYTSSKLEGWGHIGKILYELVRPYLGDSTLLDITLQTYELWF